MGLSWLARGAVLVGDDAKAERYAEQTLARCAERIAQGDTLERDHDLEIAYGAAVEVKAQLLERSSGPAAAATYVRGELARVKAPAPLFARLTKRLNMLTLTGTAAPELAVEDSVAGSP